MQSAYVYAISIIEDIGGDEEEDVHSDVEEGEAYMERRRRRGTLDLQCDRAPEACKARSEVR